MDQDGAAIVERVLKLHADTVTSWHAEPMDNPYEGFLGIVCQQHQFNFLLWHEEDIARCKDVGDQRVAEVKRAIDGFNQQRNDWIEKLDDWITGELIETRVAAARDATLNTETPGSVIDRLSIMSLRIFHMLEQTERRGVTADHLTSVRQKLSLCREQRTDLSNSLMQLLEDIFSGRKRHKTYRQMKMYNDPTLNPFLYEGKRVA